MKRILLLLLTVIMTFSFCVEAFAAGTPTVYSDEVYTTLNESFTVPIKLKNNSGIMGFKITVKYPDSQITLKDISSGSLTKTGLFNTTITDYYSVKGSFDIVWSDTANITGDGTLAMLTFETVGYADYGTYKIEIIYSQDDTFNEKWEDIKLDCKAININITDAKSASKKNEANSTTTAPKKSGEAVSDDYLIASVHAILDSYQIVDISDVTDEAQKENIVKFVNSRNQSYSKNAVQYSSFDEVKAAYNKALTNEAVVNVLESADGDKIIELSDRILKEHGAKSFSDLSDDEKGKAVDEVLDGLSAQGGDTQAFARMGDNDTAANAIDEIISGAKNDNENSITVENKQKDSGNNFVKLVVIIIIPIAIVVLAFVLLLRKKKTSNANKGDKQNEKKNN